MSSTLRVFRKLLNRRFGVYSLLFVLVSAAGLGMFIQTQVGNSILGRMLEYAAESAQPSIDLELGQLDTLGWNGVELKNVSLSIPNEEPALSVQSLKVEWSWSNDRPVTIFCVVDTPIVTVENNRDGILNWNRLFPSGESAADGAIAWPEVGLDVVIPTIEVQNGTLNLFEQSIDWSIDMGAIWSRDNTLNWQLYDIGATVAEMGTVRSSSHIDGDGDLLNVSIELAHSAGEARLNGTIADVVGDPVLNASLDVTVLPTLNQYVELPNTLKESLTLNTTLEGGRSSLKAGLVSNVGVELDTNVSVSRESFEGHIRFDDVNVEEWLSGIEQTHLTGAVQFDGTGLDWSHNLVATISGSFSDPILWKQPLTALNADLGIETGEVVVRRLQVEHDDAALSVTGTMDTIDSNGQIDVRTEIDSIRSWVPEFEAIIIGEHHVALDWSQEAVGVAITGNAEIRDVTDHQGLLLEETLLESTAQWDGENLVARNQITVENGTAVGVSIPSLTSTINVELDSAGELRIDGLPSIPEVLVGEGTLQLNQIQGYFEYTQADFEPKLRTENMTVGEVVLVPAQYVIDGGNVDLTLEEDALQAELHLLRKNRTFIHSQASADLQDGIWRIQQLDFSPTGDRAWSLKDGVSFELTENGVGELDLQLVGDAGDIHVKMDQYNNEPDIGLEILDLDMAYVRDVTNLFLGPETIPMSLNGQLFGQVNLIGNQGRFQEGDYLLVKDISSPELLNDIDVYIDLQGSLERIKTQLTVQGDDVVLAETQILLPLDDGQPSCDQSLYGQLVVSEVSFAELHQWLPFVPSIDVISTNTVQMRGTFCEPKIRVVGQGDIAVGVQGERFKWEMDLNHVEDEITGQLYVRDGVKTVLETSIEGQTMLSHILQGDSQTEVFETVTLSMQIQDVYLQRVGRLIGFPAVGKGPVKGSVQLDATPNSWSANGEVRFPRTRLAKHQLSEDSTISFSADTEGVRGDILIDFRKKGAIAGAFQYGMDDDSVFATLDCEQVPATILSIASTDIVNEHGKVEGHALVDGTLSDPQVNALVELQNVGFELPSVGVEYQAINLEAEIENGQFSISKLDGEARFTERGPLELRSWGRFGMRSTAAYSDAGIQATARLGLDNFPVINTDMVYATVSGSIHVQQDDEGTQFTGDAYVHQAGIRLNRDFFESGASLTLPDNFHIHRNVQIIDESASVDDWLDEWLKTVRGTIQVDLGDRVATHTTMPMTNDYGTGISKLSEVRVDTILRGVLSVGWNRGDPTVLGTISTIRGSFVTMGKEFELGEGEVVFSGGDVYNPQLNLYAQKSFGEYGDVAVTVAGTVDEMALDFSAVNSPYAYDQTDIVTLMLLGKPSQELANSESQTSGALIQAGLSSMGGAVGDVLSGSVVDNVDWDPTESMFRVGKTLSDTMFLSYMKNYGAEEGENTNEVTLEWLLLQRVYGEFITGDANNTEATVYYRWIF